MEMINFNYLVNYIISDGVVFLAPTSPLKNLEAELLAAAIIALESLSDIPQRRRK
jgi:hypothetical protein